MSTYEIHYRMGDPITAAWWKFMPGITIELPWITDPNVCWRPELERLVGKKGWDWDWRTSPGTDCTLIIKVRNKHAAWATMALLKWN